MGLSGHSVLRNYVKTFNYDTRWIQINIESMQQQWKKDPTDPVYVSACNDVRAKFWHPVTDQLYELSRLRRILGSLPDLQCIVIKNAIGLWQDDYYYNKVPHFLNSLLGNHLLGDCCRGGILP
jgi:hypothetical protein